MEKYFEGLTIIHVLLAYAGLLIHDLVELSKVNKQDGFNLIIWVKANLLHSLINVISIPIILAILSDPSLRDLLPINNITATLAGYQTQSLFSNLVGGSITRLRGTISSKSLDKKK